MNNLKFISHSLALAVLMMVSGNALAQQGGIQLVHKAEQLQTYTDESGAERARLVTADRVVPGEEILFTVTYTNSGSEPAEEFTITNPVPEHMDYIDGSATGVNTRITFSVDDGASFAAADQLTVNVADDAPRPAAAVDYTHIRWVVGSDVAPGASGTVQFSAIVE